MPSTLNTTGVVAGAEEDESLDAAGGDSAGAQPRLMAPHVATRAIARTERVFRITGTPKTKTESEAADRPDAGIDLPRKVSV
jgi:hypothetical protein